MAGIVIGVISDTHIPDRARRLSAQVIPVFRNAQVNAILHAGDVSIPGVLEQLAQVAPVHAVRGNRDWLALGRLPGTLELNFGGVRIAMAHGHGLFWNYLIDRVDYLFNGYKLERFTPRLLASFPEARVIIFGHTHRPYQQWVDGKLLFNPGSPHCPINDTSGPTVGLLHINPLGEVASEIIP
jgi:putative phosphoesterase